MLEKKRFVGLCFLSFGMVFLDVLIFCSTGASRMKIEEVVGSYWIVFLVKILSTGVAISMATGLILLILAQRAYPPPTD